MTAAPHWARGTGPSLEESAQANLAGDVAATKLHLGGTDRLPVDQEAARFELTEEQRADRNSRPRTRRWRALTKIDAEVDRITERHAEAISRLTAAEADLAQAPDADARSLAAWLSNGEKGSRPAATVYELTRDRDASQLLVNAIALELDGKLEERLEHIQRHRNKMLADCQSAVDDAHKQLLEKVSELPALRQALADARESLLWCSHFPERPASYGFPTAVAMGMRKPVEEKLGTSARIEYQAILDVLEADAAALASTFSADQRKQLGQADEATPITQAMWNDDERAVAWRKSELERARALAEYHPHIDRVADEASDLRP